MYEDSSRYDDIIHLPHHTSSKHPRMSKIERAAQFSPFAALTGHDAAVKETQRLTSQRIELDETALSALDARLQLLQEHLKEQPEVTLCYFQPDERKAGGEYCRITAVVRKIDLYERNLLLSDGRKIPIDELFALEGELFHWMG